MARGFLASDCGMAMNYSEICEGFMRGKTVQVCYGERVRRVGAAVSYSIRRIICIARKQVTITWKTLEYALPPLRCAL